MNDKCNKWFDDLGMMSIRRRAEEAREALSLGLQRVRMIQEQAQAVPQLQSRITQLETELHQYRYEHCLWSSLRYWSSFYTSFEDDSESIGPQGCTSTRGLHLPTRLLTLQQLWKWNHT